MNRFLPKAALLLAIALSVFEMRANPVDMRTAREVAVKFMNANPKTSLRGTDDLQLVTTYNISRGDAAFYVFNTPNGFVIVAADDCVTPILGYSYEGQFDVDNVPIQLQGILQGFVEQIQYGKENHVEADETRARQWELVRTTGRLNDNRDDEGVEPLVTTMWHQGGAFSMYVPTNCLAGCTAIAMAQVMKYWDWPVQGTGEHSYTWNGQTLSANFGETTYDWDNMLDSYGTQATQEQREAVGVLVWHCGVSLNMNYGTSMSTAPLSPSSFINYFNYSDEMSLENRRDYSDASWKAKLKDCLDLGRPLHYAGYMSVGNHAVVCDGYDSNELFHFNLGWGYGGGFYALEDIFNNRYDIAIFNIHPQSDVPTAYEINVSVNNEAYGSAFGGGTFIHGDTVTLSVNANDGYCFHHWEENGGIASIDPDYAFPANFNRHLTAVFLGPVTISTLALEGGTVSDGGIYCYYEECEVTATPDEGYDFACWTENGNTVSVEASYNFIVTGGRHLTAHFAEEGNIVFADSIVKAICLANWDYDNDGELSYAEALSVSDLGQVFKSKSNITSFDELQFFTNLDTIPDQAFYQCSKLTSITLPNTISSIGNSAFASCTRLTSLNLPNSISSIGRAAFYNCTGLISLTLPNLVSMIDYRTFYGCSGLTSLTLPDSLISIGNEAFSGCSGLTSLSFPNTLTTIGDSAFKNCSGLNGSLTLPNSISSLGNAAFSGCTGLTTLIFPDSLTTISSSAFSGCSGLTSLTLPDGLTIIGDSAFNGCSGLTGLLTIPNSVTTIGSYAFHNCSSLTSLSLPDSVISIGNYAFYNCSGLTGLLTLPNTVTTINEYVFSGCSGLTSLTLPSSVTLIGNNAFYNNKNLTSIIVLAETPPTVRSDAFYKVDSNIPVYVPCESVAAYQAANGWSAFSNIVGLCGTGTVTIVADLPEGGVVAGAGAYESGDYCTVNAVPNEGCYFVNWTENDIVVSSNAEYGFIVTGDRLLTAHFAMDGNIVFADANVKAICVANWDTNGDGELSYSEACSVTSIGEVFSGNTEITSFEELQYFTKLSAIGNNAFNGCSGLTGSLFLPNSVTLIGAYAFSGCSGLTGPLVLPDGLTTIGNSAFRECRGFTGDLTLPNSVTTLGECAFYYCNGFTGHLTLSNSLTSIGNFAFYFCSGFKGSLVIPNSVYSIGKYAFSYCRGFNGNLVIGNSVNSIDKSAFEQCYGFTGSLIIPSSVGTIGEMAFYCCIGLNGNLTIMNSVYSIGRYAFSGTSGLKSIVVLWQHPVSVVLYSFEYDIPLYVPCASVEAYQSATGWSAFTNIIGMCSPGWVSVVADPVEGGEVSGAGTYEGGAVCTVTATPNEGYCFAYWKENGVVVWFDSVYSFIVTGETDMTAHFVPDGNIVFADANVKAICVAKWDVNGDGELSYREAATVLYLGDVFKGHTEITSFDELQYFTGLSSINDYAFNGCNNLTSVIIPGTVTSIESGAFYNCSGLTGDLIIPNSVTQIGPSAFYGCSGLTGSLTIPDAVTSIGNYAFEYCSGFTGSLTISNSVTSIGKYAFYGCCGFSGKLTIGSSVNSIGNNAFLYCSDFTSMKVLPETPPIAGNAFYSDLYDIPVHVPCGSLEAYQEADGWSNFTDYWEDCLQTQIVTFVAGWNWFSTYIELDDPVELLQLLENSLGDNGVQIESVVDGVNMNAGGDWAGNLDGVGLLNEHMYLVEVTEDVTVELQGSATHPADHLITIYPYDWSWIGYPCAEEVDVNVALSGFWAEEGDMIETLYGEEGGLIYYYDGAWVGDFDTMIPGRGYMYFSNSTQPKTLVFSTTSKGKNVFLRKRKE